MSAVSQNTAVESCPRKWRAKLSTNATSAGMIDATPNCENFRSQHVGPGGCDLSSGRARRALLFRVSSLSESRPRGVQMTFNSHGASPVPLRLLDSLQNAQVQATRFKTHMTRTAPMRLNCTGCSGCRMRHLRQELRGSIGDVGVSTSPL